jgi:16S rRNA (guanine966-N2)-methyltransferase
VPDRPGLRPTPDRVRETLFNWLGQDLTGWRVLDAFAGSGALGFEAASRGAAEVQLLESDGTQVRLLEASRVRLGAGMVAVSRADALAWMARATRETSGQFELVLLDPPFDAGVLERAIELATALVVPGGFVYAESGAPCEVPAGLEPWRQLRAGTVFAQLLRRPA